MLTLILVVGGSVAFALLIEPYAMAACDDHIDSQISVDVAAGKTSPTVLDLHRKIATFEREHGSVRKLLP